MCRPRHGFTLLELILVLGLMSVMTLLSFYEKQTDLEQARARQVGGIIYQYNNAVRSALAQGLVPSTTTKSGTDWLKNSSCGGVLAVGSELLPCSFPAATTLDPIPFGRLSLSTAVVVTGTAPSKKYTATTVTSPFTLVSTLGVGHVRADLAGVATLSAAAALTSGFQSSASSGLTPYTATTDSSYKSDPLTGKITIVASNTANNDVWLRTDGGNEMHATLNFDGLNPNDRKIVGASSIQNFAGQVLRIGSGSGLTPVTGAGVVIDSDTEILGDFRVRRSLSVDNSLYVTGNITATAAVRAGTNVEANGSVVAQGNVTAAGAMISPIYYDANNTGYYVDPHATSNLNTLTAAGNVTANGAVVSQIFYDANNMGYYVDPHATSNLNALYSNYLASNGRIRAAEFVEIGGVANVGWGCSPNGLIGRDAAGGVLSCKNGLWQAGGLTLGPVQYGGVTGYDVTDGGSTPYESYCPPNTVMVGLHNTTWGDYFTLICR